MYKNLGEIFSDTISQKFTSLTKYERENMNIINIKNLKNNNEELKNIFDITFIQCLNHFIGKTPIPILNGLKTFDKYIIEDKKYEEKLKSYANNYEEKVSNSRSRKRSKKKKDNNI